MKTPSFSSRFLSVLLPLLALLPQAGRAQLTQRPQVGAYFDGVLPKEAPVVATGWSTVVAFPNLSFQNPVGLAPLPGTNQLVVWEREGRVWAFDNDPAVTVKTLLLDLSKNCQGWDDSGLLGLAFHPDFLHNRQVFAWYNWRGGIPGRSSDLGPIQGSPTSRVGSGLANRNRLARFVLGATPEESVASEYVLLDEQTGTVLHNGGGMFFHPQDGFLYLADGDDNYYTSNGGTTGRFYGAVLRIDVDRRGGAVSHPPTKKSAYEVDPNWPRYYVPNDNPFSGQPGALGEIHALGLRNPCKMTLDEVTGRIFIGDVGMETWEEIDVIEPTDPAGLNFQWPGIEGPGKDLPATSPGLSRRPVYAYAHGGDDGSCVIGGYVYRGSAFPDLVGKYLFGDNMSGRIWYLDESATPVGKVLLATLPDGPGPNSGNDYCGLSGFGRDAAGELYVCQMSSTDARIYKLQRGAAAPEKLLPATLSGTGFFTDMANLTPSPRLLPYDLNAPFWSDGAVKTRYVAVPDGTTVGFTPQGEWSFPEGSVFVKHFDLPVSDVDPARRRRVETRFLVKKADGGVYGATYKWRADQTDADLLDGAATESIPVETAALGALTGVDIGVPAVAGATVREGHGVTVKSGGGSIDGVADELHFAYQLRSGDFDVAVRVASLDQGAANATLAGLMARESLAADSRQVAALVYSANTAAEANGGGYLLRYRAETGAAALAVSPPAPGPKVAYPDTWLRLQRAGDVFTGYSSRDGAVWTEFSRVTQALPAQLYFGLTAVTPGAAAFPTVTAAFELETRRQLWTYPGRQNCVTCHNPQSGGVLGLNTRQLNRDVSYHGGVVESQLRAWSHAGYFTNAPADAAIPGLEKLAAPGDTTASVELRARSYLDVNCANCHRPDGVRALWDARFQTPFAQAGIKYGAVVNNLGNPAARVVVPHDLPDSVLHTRVNRVGENQMPPIGRNTIDAQGVALLAQWIAGLPEEIVAAPVLVSATPVSHTRVDLVWQDRSANETGFAIERSVDGAEFVRIGTVAAGVTAFSDLAAESFTAQAYRVVAAGTYVSSAYSNVVTAVPDVGPAAAEIRLTGPGGVVIPDRDFTADAASGTDFGVVRAGQTVTRSFTIANLGNAPLLLTGSPKVRVSGPDAAWFAVVAQPAAGSLDGGQSAGFELVFTPLEERRASALVTILSNDGDEAATVFAVTGEGVAASLAGWWKFDEVSGTVAEDSSGNGLTGTLRPLTGPLPGRIPGVLDGALSFAGDPYQVVMMAANPLLSPDAATTFSCWVKVADGAAGRVILSRNYYFWLGTGPGGTVSCRASGSSGDSIQVQANVPALNAWFHVAVTADATSLKMYLNGQLRHSVPFSGPVRDSAGFGIGGPPTTSFSAPATHFIGGIDDVRFYREALKPFQIAALAGRSAVVSIAADDAVAQRGVDGGAGSVVVTRTGSMAGDLPVALALEDGAGQAAEDGAGQAAEGGDVTFQPGLAQVVIPAGASVATVAVKPAAAAAVTGNLEATVTVADAPGYVVGAPAAATVRILDSPYHLWKIGAFGSLAAAQGTAAADGADADSDGLSTFMEAALGGDPLAPDAGRLPQPRVEMIDGGLYLTLSYTRPKPGVAGLFYAGRTTADLAQLNGWQDAVMAGGSPHDNGDGTETVKMRTALPVGAAPRQFMRLEVSRP